MARDKRLIRSYEHLADFPRQDEALSMLMKVAAMVMPIMEARGFTVKKLTEFYPTDRYLLGMNSGGGKKIALRLRHEDDPTQFLPLGEVLHIMLHELCHNVHGPHNRSFHALWEQLTDDLTDLALTGYNGTVWRPTRGDGVWAPDAQRTWPATTAATAGPSTGWTPEAKESPPKRPRKRHGGGSLTRQWVSFWAGGTRSW